MRKDSLGFTVGDEGTGLRKDGLGFVRKIRVIRNGKACLIPEPLLTADDRRGLERNVPPLTYMVSTEPQPPEE